MTFNSGHFHAWYISQSLNSQNEYASFWLQMQSIDDNVKVKLGK